MGLTRGKGCSPDAPVPYEKDGADAAAVIDWISRQPWSDGRVGMYGGSYEGFTQWAAAKHMPKALKALMPSVAVAPGIDVPMEGNVFQTFVYYWPFYTTTNKTLDDAPYNDQARWFRMNHEWYVSGRAYRALDKIDGTPNPFFNRWLDHPSYDAYWRSMIPYGQEFARIDIPVLTTTGYYDGAQLGALYYFTQHHQYAASARHYLVIGPYDHVRGQRGTVSRLGNPLTSLRGYETDPVAQIDIGELRYQWFDYIFKGGPKPAVLKDKVNYEVMGANDWKHAPSLAAMANQRVRFHLSAERTGDDYRLSTQKPAGKAFVPQRVDLADRTDMRPDLSRRRHRRQGPEPLERRRFRQRSAAEPDRGERPVLRAPRLHRQQEGPGLQRRALRAHGPGRVLHALQLHGARQLRAGPRPSPVADAGAAPAAGLPRAGG